MPTDDAPRGSIDPAKAQEKEGSPQEGLTDYWRDVLGPRPESDEARLVRELGTPHPGTLTFATNTGRIIVQIDPNGKVTLGEGVTADDAAEQFWTSMALKRKGMEERLLHFGMIEALLQRVARADIAYEHAYYRAHQEDATDAEKYREELQRRNLEAIVHQMIEYSRGLLQRPEPPVEGAPPPAETDVPQE